MKIEILIKDGTPVQPGDIVATITGSVTGILKAERTALNFLQRLSGIASLTAQYVAEVSGFKAKIVDTRKTTPGLRLLEKYAVRMGGGYNHRLHLGDAVLIKDNHIAALRAMGLGLKDIVAKARKNAPAGMTIEVEVTSAREAVDALKAGADIIMLDNMSVSEMKQVVNMVAGKAKLEASGGITLANVRQVAMTGVDIISIGALTHSYKALDISLEIGVADFTAYLAQLFSAIQHHRYRAVVMDFYLHVLLETSGGYFQAAFARQPHGVVKKGFRRFRRGRIGKAGTASLDGYRREE